MSHPLSNHIAALAQSMRQGDGDTASIAAKLDQLAKAFEKGAYHGEVLAWLETRSKEGRVESITHPASPYPEEQKGWTRLSLIPLGLVGGVYIDRPVEETVEELLALAQMEQCSTSAIPGIAHAEQLRRAAHYLVQAYQPDQGVVNLDVVRRSYDFSVGYQGQVLGLTAGDQHWEETGIVCNMAMDNWVQVSADEQKCNYCHTCRPNTLADQRMILCPDCGNKRCPKANWHLNACTRSNAPGQKGSAYEAVRPASGVAALDQDPEEDLFLDNVLDALFKQEGHQGFVYKAAMEFMLNRRQWRARVLQPLAEGKDAKAMQETLVEALQSAKGWTKEYAKEYVNQWAGLKE